MKKTCVLVVLFISSLEACSTPFEDQKTPYVIALENKMKSDDVMSLIVEKSQHLRFHNNRIKVTGFIDFEHSRLFIDDLFRDDPYLTGKDNEVSFYLDFDEDDMSSFNCPESMVQIEGLYQYNNPEYEYLHVLREISIIEYFDITPIPEGGSGDLFVCYP